MSDREKNSRPKIRLLMVAVGIGAVLTSGALIPPHEHRHHVLPVLTAHR